MKKISQEDTRKLRDLNERVKGHLHKATTAETVKRIEGSPIHATAKKCGRHRASEACPTSPHTWTECSTPTT